MTTTPPTVRDLVERLRGAYGTPPAPLTRDPFELVLLESAAYLVADDVRARVFEALRSRVGTEPAAILTKSPAALAAVIRDGGMHPDRRAEKLRTAAQLANELGLDALRDAVRTDPKRARAMLKRFPGIGDPGADRILLLAGGRPSLAPDSNALRVLVRVGFGVEHRDYAATYRAATDAAGRDLDESPAWFVDAHALLRTHGQERCRRTQPGCDGCVLRPDCAHGAAQ